MYTVVKNTPRGAASPLAAPKRQKCSCRRPQDGLQCYVQYAGPTNAWLWSRKLYARLGSFCAHSGLLQKAKHTAQVSKQDAKSATCGELALSDAVVRPSERTIAQDIAMKGCKGQEQGQERAAAKGKGQCEPAKGQHKSDPYKGQSKRDYSKGKKKGKGKPAQERVCCGDREWSGSLELLVEVNQLLGMVLGSLDPSRQQKCVTSMLTGTLAGMLLSHVGMRSM